MNKKNFLWNIVGSLMNAATSLFFMIIVTRINGVDIAGIFSFAFTFSLLIQVIGSYSGRSYQVTETDETITDSDYVYSRFFTCFIMILAAAAFILFKNYTNEKIIIMLLLVVFRVIESTADVLYGIIQKNEKLYQVGISLFLKGLLMTLLFLLTDIFTKNIIISTLMLGIVNLVILIFYDLKNTKKCNFKLNKINKQNLTKILKGGFFVFIFYFLIQYVINAPKYSIDNYLSDKYQFIYGILLMPSTLIGLFSQFFVQPFLNEITKYVKEKDYQKLNKLNIKISAILIIALIITEIIAYFIGVPVLNIVYNINIEQYKTSLLIIIVGATFFGISYLISTSLIAMRKNFIQTIIYIITAITTYIISDIFVQKWKILGASYAYLITMIILVIMYLIVYMISVKKEGKKYGKSIDNSTGI